MRWKAQRRPRVLVVYVDGAVGAERRATGLGVVIRDLQGRILDWRSQRVGALDNNAAEYAALVLGLEAVRTWRPQTVHVCSDSEIVVRQMNGRFAVRSPGLRSWHRQACALARQIPRVTYTHLPRECNRLADALANEGLEGWALPEGARSKE